MKDFLNDVQAFVADKASKVSSKADEILAVQGLYGQIRTAKKEIAKHYAELGKIVCKKYSEGVEVALDAKPHCEEVERLQKLIAQYQQEAEAYKKKDEDDLDDIWKDDFEDEAEEEAEVAEETAEETAEKAAEAAAEEE